MISIMQHLQKYIPYVRQHTFVPVPGSDECEEVRSDIFISYLEVTN